eukprot:TRINITY_DN9825_c0_g1_i2.p2 TRINITY_DN9825_c0_g1~~TRINITY_DN9825_c0_g1_i2.p2  ORF type:complete len:110 (-),score=16.15 TRINITY_DN9825_c0_g1_i2:685-1014(-)
MSKMVRSTNSVIADFSTITVDIDEMFVSADAKLPRKIPKRTVSVSMRGWLLGLHIVHAPRVGQPILTPMCNLDVLSYLDISWSHFVDTGAVVYRSTGTPLLQTCSGVSC